MSKWTLRPQATGGPNGAFSAADRAAQYVRRHGWQFHGAGVEDAVRQLKASGTVRQGPGSISVREIGVARDLAAFDAGPMRLEWEDAPPVFEETAHGLTVVGWKGENGCAHCPEHRPMGGTMITAADLGEIGTVLCLRCGTELGTAPAIPPAECNECGHAHVQGVQCVEDTFGSFMCGCTE